MGFVKERKLFEHVINPRILFRAISFWQLVAGFLKTCFRVRLKEANCQLLIAKKQAN